MPARCGYSPTKCCIGIDPRIAALGPHRDALLGLDRRLDAVRPAPVVGDAAGPLVDELDAAVADDVVAIAAEQRFGVERDVDGAEEQVVATDGRAATPSAAPALREPGFGEDDRAAVLVGGVVDAAPQAARRAPPARRGRSPSAGAGPAMTSGTRASSIRMQVGLVDDRDSWPRWTTAAGSVRGVIAEEVEARLLGGDVGDVGVVGLRAASAGVMPSMTRPRGRPKHA